MDIEEFYDANERRRTSAELQFGQDWRDAHGRRYELNWVEDTGELYVMRDDPPEVWSDPFGDVVSVKVDADHLGVKVLKLVHGTDQVQELLTGWEAAMAGHDSVAWLIDRLSSTRTS